MRGVARLKKTQCLCTSPDTKLMKVDMDVVVVVVAPRVVWYPIAT